MYVLHSLRWLALLHSGWVTGWLQGATRHASRTLQSRSPSLRTPLLTEQVKRLRLNPDAPMRPKKPEPQNVVWLRG